MHFETGWLHTRVSFPAEPKPRYFIACLQLQVSPGMPSFALTLIYNLFKLLKQLRDTFLPLDVPNYLISGNKYHHAPTLNLFLCEKTTLHYNSTNEVVRPLEVYWACVLSSLFIDQQSSIHPSNNSQLLTAKLLGETAQKEASSHCYPALLSEVCCTRWAALWCR